MSKGGSKKRTNERGWCSIAGDGTDFHAGLFGQSSHKNSFSGGKGVFKSITISLVHGLVVARVNQKNRGFDHMAQSGICRGKDGLQIVNGLVNLFSNGAGKKFSCFWNQGDLTAAVDGASSASKRAVARNGFGHGASIAHFFEPL